MSALNISKSYNYNYNNNLKKVIPFLIERKYCYSSPKKKGVINSDGTPSIKTPQSKYTLFDSLTKPLILKEIKPTVTTMQPDDFLKEKVINSFTNIILNEVSTYKDQAVQSGINDTLDETNNTLRKHQKKILINLNDNLNELNNEKHNNITSYSKKDYNKNKYAFYINLIINTLLVFVIIFALHSLSSGDPPVLPKKIILYANIIIIGVYMTYLIVKLNSSNDRNKSNWNQFNFRNISIEENV
jgi:hypothetical protein|tara:strand:- start:5285 stop:6013 length:729 start_codon:yes stop_codon:yes gene_type:complete